MPRLLLTEYDGTLFKQVHDTRELYGKVAARRAFTVGRDQPDFCGG